MNMTEKMQSLSMHKTKGNRLSYFILSPNYDWPPHRRLQFSTKALKINLDLQRIEELIESRE